LLSVCTIQHTATSSLFPYTTLFRSHWGQFTTFKRNAAALLRKSVRPEQIIYCSPLVDPYQPAEAEQMIMPEVLDVLIERPPRVLDRKSTRLNSSHQIISYAVFCLKK